ncbi:MAG: ABC transporter substrate-binding protein, partial [Gemmatimonadales bacterium]|nr:ABC transporter substrate-binding protein [Gemmatimonadales bacterium]
PGVEQKAAWLQVRRDRPDAVILFGWGVMNSTAIKEAVATGFPRDKLYGIWYSGGEPDVAPAGDGGKGYNAVTLLAPGGKGKIHEELLAAVHDKGQASGPRDEVGQVYHTRGVIAAMLTVEALKKAMSRYGNKPMTGEQVRWGLENLNIDDAAIKKLGFEGFMYPLSTSCVDHMGVNRSQIMTWNGKSWDVNPKIYEADMQVIKPMIRRVADAYAKEKNITPRDCAKESQE